MGRQSRRRETVPMVGEQLPDIDPVFGHTRSVTAVSSRMLPSLVCSAEGHIHKAGYQ
jgi:hypothetical protein